MSSTFLLQHFDRLAEAPGGIAKLRALIVHLAMQGNLVPQSTADEPASVLLNRIRTEKKRLVTYRSISNEKPLPEIEAGEIPFEIPKSWVWSRLGDALEYCAGDNASPDELSSNAWLLELEDIEKDSSRLINEAVVTDRNPTSHKTKFCVGDVLYGKLRPYLNKVIVAHREGYCTTEIIALRPLCDVDPRFVKWALKRPDFLAYVARVGYGTKMPRLGTDDGRVAFLPLPPLGEQRRIVAKVEELMGLCDALEAAQREREAVRTRLRTSALHQLASPDSDFRSAAFLLRNLPHFTIAAEDLPLLRQTIFQLAISGGLLTRIGPWKTVRLDSVAECRLGKMLDAYKNRGRPTKYLRNTNVHWFRFELDSIKELKLEPDEFAEYELRSGDVMICEGGHGIARTAVWHGEIHGIIFQKALHRVRPTKDLDPEFFSYVMRVFYDTGVLAEFYTGSGIPHLTRQELKKIPIPLPPLAEQRQIVAKVDELMAVLDALEAALTTARTTSEKLLAATIAKLLAA